MSFHKEMFLNNRTDTPNRYAATRAASGTAASTSGLHVGTYKEDKMRACYNQMLLYFKFVQAK